MATIKDVAKLAGVSLSTVSNVLNGKGNVTSKTSRSVEDAARQLGFKSNRQAKTLRSLKPMTLSLILPSLQSQQYIDCFRSFTNYAEQNGYHVSLFITNNLQETELKHIYQLQQNEVAGIAVCTSLPNPIEAYADWLDRILFIDRQPQGQCSSMRFDLQKAGEELAQAVISERPKNVLFVGENSALADPTSLAEGFLRGIQGKSITCRYEKTSQQTCSIDLFQWINRDNIPDIIVCEQFSFAQSFFNNLHAFFPDASTKIFSISSLRTIPDGGVIRCYELNYSMLGHKAAEELIRCITHPSNIPNRIILKNDGIRSYPSIHLSKGKQLNILTMDSPTARILKNVTRMYTVSTGIDVNIAIYSYESYQEMFADPSVASAFDIIRTDMHRLSQYAEKALYPLEKIDSSISDILPSLLPGLSPEYTHVNGELFALPGTPSAELLFYRKDIYENNAISRQYLEETGEVLAPPASFEEFNKQSRFFTRAFNRYSPFEYGTNLALGSSSLLAKDYLARYFSHADSLYDDDWNPQLQSAAGRLALQELLELKPCISSRYFSSRTEIASDFAVGNIALTLMFSNYAGNAFHDGSNIIDRVGYSMVPGSNPLLGGGVIGICRQSNQKNEALDLIRWLLDDVISGAITMLGSVSPLKKVYDNYSIIDRYPWLTLSKNCFAESKAVHAPSGYSKPFKDLQFLNIIGTAVNSAYNNIISPNDALAQADIQIQQLL